MARKPSRNKVDAAPVIAVPAVEGLLTRDEVAAILAKSGAKRSQGGSRKVEDREPLSTVA